jgi:fructose-1,6-bisphosphatase/inositol monophosphatase family enzyme
MELVISAAKKAGSLLRREFYRNIPFDPKGNHDIVTRADHESESLILGILHSGYPDYGIITEESDNISGESDYCWYIDPLDGTSNFITGNPYFAVSIALAEKNVIVLGVVYNPVSGDLFQAETGSGAYLNGNKISVSDRSDLADSFVAVAFSAEEDKIKKGITLIERLVLSCRRIVVNFAPSLDLCNIARGKIDALIDNGSTPEDHAAGSLILTEAGGLVRNLDQAGWDVNRTGIIASNSKIDVYSGIMPSNK